MQFCYTTSPQSPRNIKSPLPASIHTWPTSVCCMLGYLTNVISLVCRLTENETWMRDVVLIVDVMSLHKITIFDKKQESFVGLVDHGTAIPELETTEGTEALVFETVGITGHWKHPIAYVLPRQMFCICLKSTNYILH